MENKLFTYSSSPHVRSPKTTRQIMARVAIALLPSAIMGIVYFGLTAAIILALSVLSAVASEYIYLLICKKPLKEINRQFDFSSVVTGLLARRTLGLLLVHLLAKSQSFVAD